MTSVVRRIKLPIILLSLQVFFIILFALFVDYEDAANPLANPNPESPIDKSYGMFQNIHFLIFVGIALLYVYLQRYAYSATGYNFLLSALAVQWAIIIRALIFKDLSEKGTVQLTLDDMMLADFNAVTILISFGFVIGKTSPLQLTVMTILEIIFANINEYVGLHYLQVSDIGASIFIHVFATYFGMAVSRVLYEEDHDISPKEVTGYQSDIFVIAGTIIIWCLWPSFVGCLATGDEQLRAVVNTYIALMASVIVTLATSALTDKRGRFTFSHLQNATLAGGIGIGTCANMPIQLWGAMVIGSLAPFTSVIGYRYISNILNRKFSINDPAGVNNLHGLPGILAATAGAIVAATATEKNFGTSLYEIFPAMAPTAETTEYLIMSQNLTWLKPGLGRTSGIQAGYQFLALVMTISVALITGMGTGFVMKITVWDNVLARQLFDDEPFWNVPTYGFPEVTVDIDGKLTTKL